MPSFTSINAENAEAMEGQLVRVKDEGDSDDGLMPAAQTVVTPKKRGRKKNGGGAATDDQETPTKKAKSTPDNGTPSKKAATKPIPSSYEEASPEDRMIIRMKDHEGKGWTDIKAAWEAITGKKVGGSTLQVRYSRLKANFVTFTAEDETNVLETKKEIEDRFEQEKWHKIAEAMEAKSGKKLPAAAIQKKFKELSKKDRTSAMIVKQEAEAEAEV